ncbi:MAG TPA: PTS mannitol transporter subunit IICB [Candidatus Limnocylindrales bacterium]|nr:PTS mannitol transporter subunit IICB [Candidatus Limnocylindrales bacterium]HEV8699550.1 PTS mannitol transporter subunit IICB [Candidatus Limnocylindrales bacterium]
MKERIQRYGGYLAAMVLPNIGAILAWGLITAFVIPTGWTPNKQLEALVGPMIRFLLPILIAYTGGKLVHGHRGGVVGAIFAAGIIIGSEAPMFLGAMIVGPIGGFLIKLYDDLTEERVPSGFEMLSNTFSAGIIGAIGAVIGVLSIGPILQWGSDRLGDFVSAIISAGLLPLADIPIEVGKVLFLNNAINHGVLGPLGVAAAAASPDHRAIHFLLETNPGPGLGLLLSFMFFGKGLAKLSAPGSIIIHFFGGIHEIYFPYVLSHPIMIAAMWAGGIAADIVFVATNAGLVATPSPGSIFAYLAVIPPGQHFGVLAGVATGAVASFAVGSLILRLYPVKETEEEAELEGAPSLPAGVPA